MSVYYEKQYSHSNYNFYHLFNDEYYTDELHCHDFIEIYLCISGCKCFLLNDTLYDVKKGDLFVVNNLDVHRVIREKDVCYERYVLEYKPSYALNFCTPKTDLMHYLHNGMNSNSRKMSLREEQFDYFIDLLRSYESIDDKSYGSDLKKEICFLEILVYVAEFFYEESAINEININSIDSTINSLLAYIGDNLTEDLCIENLASQVNVSKHYLCFLFKKNTGITINHYVSSKRVAYAKKLLLQGGTITEISEKAGFNSLSNFTRTFHRITGTSPTKYIKQELQK